MDRNEVKLEMVKKVLGVHNWKLWQNKRIYLQHIFILDGNGKVMAEYISRYNSHKSCYVRASLYGHSMKLFCLSVSKSVDLINTILVQHFGLEVNSFNLDTDFIRKQWNEIEMNLKDGEYL